MKESQRGSFTFWIQVGRELDVRHDVLETLALQLSDANAGKIFAIAFATPKSLGQILPHFHAAPARVRMHRDVTRPHDVDAGHFRVMGEVLEIHDCERLEKRTHDDHLTIRTQGSEARNDNFSFVAHGKIDLSRKTPC